MRRRAHLEHLSAGAGTHRRRRRVGRSSGRRQRPPLDLAFALALALAPAASVATPDDPVPETVRFNRDVRPLLSDACFACHGPDKGRRKARLRLDEEKGLLADRKSRTVSPGKPELSELYRRISSDDEDERMPPADSGKKLTPRQIEIIRRWIEQGARWEKHWAYNVRTRPEPPRSPRLDRVASPIDRFLLARSERAGVQPGPTTDPATLIRRLTLDLTGLPPDPAEVDAFVGDTSPRAYESLVDRLLSSPHYGERMAIYWLDLVRYADSVGYHKDSHRNVWLYRDYVVRAFNDNKPFDRFTLEQVAGDLLTGTKYEQYEWKVASGFNRMNQTTSEGGAQAGEYLVKYSADRVRNTAAIFLGSTMGCAECHDHKFDPFTTRDFYSFAAFFADLQERGVGFPSESPMPSGPQLTRWREIDSELARLKGGIATESTPDATVGARIKSLEEELEQVANRKHWAKTIITQPGKPRTVRILPRGNWMDRSGPVVEPAIPAFLGKIETEGRASRVDLARWIVGRDNPLTARVLVNRLWKLLFGEGICRVLDDVGTRGQWPTHPQLLDWLAVEFIDSGWDIKHMVKLLVMTRAYRRSSTSTAELRKLDPENRLVARQSRFRLAAELVRDNALAVSGLLSRKMGGRSVKPYQPANYWYRLYKDAKYVQERGEDLYRRGIYTYWRRSYWHPSLRAFDAPAREECVADRPRSNTPQQSLVLLNDPTYVEAARAFAASIIREGGSTDRDRLTWAFRRALSRPPTDEEVEVLAGLRERQARRYSKDETAAKALLSTGDSPLPEDVPPAEVAAWTSVARVLLNLHETITRS